MVDELLVSVLEAARRLGISRTVLDELIGDEVLRVVKLGARTLVAVSELERFATDLSKSGAVWDRAAGDGLESGAESGTGP